MNFNFSKIERVKLDCVCLFYFYYFECFVWCVCVD